MEVKIPADKYEQALSALKESHAAQTKLSEALTSAVVEDENTSALIFDLHVDSETETSVLYEVSMEHPGDLPEAIGVQMAFLATDLKIKQYSLPNMPAFPIWLTPSASQEPVVALGSPPQLGGFKKGKAGVLHIMCDKLQPNGSLTWDYNARPSNRVTTRDSKIIPTAWTMDGELPR